jgi:rhamnogalacturonan endolyase
VVKVFEDRFEEFRLGGLPFDYTAVGEYHCLDLPRLPNGWVEVTTHTGWGRLGNWQVVEDGGRRVMQQARLREAGMPMLAAGDSRWRDLAVEAEVRLLSQHTEAGVMARYGNNRTHYSLRISGEGSVRLMRRRHEEKVVLAEGRWEPEFEGYHALRLEVEGARLRGRLDGKAVFEVEQGALTEGRIGLLATGPARFRRVEVEVGEAEVKRLRAEGEAQARELAELGRGYPRPVLWRKIETREFGTGRHIRFGDLDGDGRLEMVLAQYTDMLNGGDFPLLSCLTAIDLEGNVLWQWGEPNRGHGIIPCDLAFQVHDVDGDGCDEVICCRNFEICMLEGSTGELKRSAPTPATGPMATWLKEDDLFRIPGDSICFADLRGLGRRSDVLVKDRYSNVTAYDDEFNVLWRFHGNTGHYPAVADVDGDGRDEVMIGYSLVDHDGRVLWRIEVEDHQDAIAIAPLEGEGGRLLIALACGEGGTVVCDTEGEVQWRDRTGHVQRLTAARVRGDVPGLQIVTKTFWGNPDIICVYDARGKMVETMELAGGGAVLSPVNWRGDGVELLLTSGSLRLGGMLDGHLRRVVAFPDDGHPTLCAEAIDLTEDPRDEIVLWDLEGIWIYTQDGPAPEGKVYRPRRQPHYNMSDYRAEVSVPEWESG